MAERACNIACHQWRHSNKYQALCGASACQQAILDATRSTQSLHWWLELLTHYKWFWEEAYSCGEHDCGCRKPQPLHLELYGTPRKEEFKVQQ